MLSAAYGPNPGNASSRLRNSGVGLSSCRSGSRDGAAASLRRYGAR